MRSSSVGRLGGSNDAEWSVLKMREWVPHHLTWQMPTHYEFVLDATTRPTLWRRSLGQRQLSPEDLVAKNVLAWMLHEQPIVIEFSAESSMVGDGCRRLKG